MPESIKSAFSRLSEFIKKADRKKLVIISLAVVLAVAAGVIIAVLLNRTKYTVLFSSLSAEEAGSILTKLEGMGIDAKAQGADTILVPAEQADDLRMQLAGEGYPQTGLNYDLFSSSSAIGSTDLQQQTYLQYQLQENMRATINRMSKVKDSIVIVNLASSSSYVLTENTSEARAAVLLNLENGQELTSKEARTIGQFVLKCVPKLSIENISIVDSNMNYYNIADEKEEEDDVPYTDTMRELTEQLKQTLKGQVLNVLEPAIGKGNVAVSVNLNLDFDKKTVNSVEYGPPIEGETQGMYRSSEESVESSDSGYSSGGVQTNTNQNEITDYAPSSQNTEATRSETKTYNYELNQIETQIEKAQGEIKELSVAVLVNSNIAGIADYADTIENLVSKAVGVEPDSISVELMPFAEAGDALGLDGGDFGDYFDELNKTAAGISRQKLINTVVICLTLIIIVIILLNFMARKIQIFRGGHYLSASEAPGEYLDMGVESGVEGGEKAVAERIDYLKDMKLGGGQEIEKVEQLLNEAPEAFIQTLRSWLNEED